MSNERIDALSSEDVDTLVEIIIDREDEIAELRKANRQLASAAIDRPPYKSELRERADAMAKALDRWWGGKCPESWSEKRHHDRPYVNTQGSHERGLVDALAAYRKATTTQEET